jgi:hypothetical protein
MKANVMFNLEPIYEPIVQYQPFTHGQAEELNIRIKKEKILGCSRFRPLVAGVCKTFILMIPGYRERKWQIFQAVCRAIHRCIVDHYELAQPEN